MVILQDHQGISNVAPADIPLCPLSIHNAVCSLEQEAINSVEEARIHDYVSGLRFRISPTAFFQVRNTDYCNSYAQLKSFCLCNWIYFESQLYCRLIPLLLRSSTHLLEIGLVWVLILCFLISAVVLGQLG